MRSWHSKSLGDGMWADIPSEEIRRIFQPLFESVGRPAAMAVFTRHEEGSLHCEWVAYFSPAADEAALWELRDTIALQLNDPPTVAELVEPAGRAWNNMSFVNFAPGDRTDRGRVVSLAYAATFIRFL